MLSGLFETLVQEILKFHGNSLQIEMAPRVTFPFQYGGGTLTLNKLILRRNLGYAADTFTQPNSNEFVSCLMECARQ